MMFQFYLSSIKSGNLIYPGGSSFVFQFYLSSIKSANARSRKLGLMMFQFYLSSIKRNGNLATLGMVESFNSTLVQLKVLWLLMGK